jgi:hypothetical protein
MNHQNEFVEHIRQLLEGGDTSLSRTFSRFSFETTAALADGSLSINKIESKEFTPSKKVLIFYLCFPLIILFITIFQNIRNNSKEFENYIFGILISIFFTSIILYQFSFNRKLNYTIHLDLNGIRINQTIYEWRNIWDTAILSEISSKSQKDYLVIGMRDRATIEKFELHNFSFNAFSNFAVTLSHYIEFFKSESTKINNTQQVSLA